MAETPTQASEPRRYRNVLDDGPLGTVVSIVWDPGAQSAHHDHNVSGRTTVIRGKVWERTGDSLTKRYFVEGDIFHEMPGIFHTVGTDEDGDGAITVHRYDGHLEMTTKPAPTES